MELAAMSEITSLPQVVAGADLEKARNTSFILDAFLTRRSQQTRKAYQTDLHDFAKRLNCGDIQSAIWALISQGPTKANGMVMQYKALLMRDGKTPATVNRRLSTLRSVISLAKILGIVSWTLQVPNERAAAYRDTRGPGSHGVRAMLEASSGDSPKARRDRAIIRLMYDLALRRGEVVSLRLEDVDLAGGRVLVKGKGRSEREALTLPGKTIGAIREWLEVRGTIPGPLFTNYDHARKGTGGLTGAALWYIVKTLGEKAELRTRPHGIRHAAITEALDRTRDPRAVQRFSRHRDLGTVLRYDDNREDLAGKVAEVVAAGV
jgi:integrase/recombinase XerC